MKNPYDAGGMGKRIGLSDPKADFLELRDRVDELEREVKKLFEANLAALNEAAKAKPYDETMRFKRIGNEG